MKLYRLKLMVLMLVVGLSTAFVWANETSIILEDETIKSAAPLQADFIYQRLLKNNPSATNNLSKEAFNEAYNALINLKKAKHIAKDQNIITICDFSLSSNLKRMWIVDVMQAKVLIHSLVSHGKNTGEEYAVTFSNKMSSYQSSLGVYVTTDTYQGSNGYSLKLVGMDKGLNDKAEERAIVLHGADYCSEAFIKEHGRLGRSFGCPSVPVDLHEQVINTIKNKSVLYIYQAGHKELMQSKWIKAPSEITAPSVTI